MNKQFVSLFFILILALVFSINYWPRSNLAESSPPVSNADYYLSNVSIKRFNNQGLLVDKMTAEKLEHFKTSKLSHIVAPQITLLNQSKDSWHISARTGQFDQASNQIELINSVIIAQSRNNEFNGLALDPTQANTSIKTERLLLNLNSGHADTTNQVVITSRDIKTTADSMSADFKNNLITLKGKTQTEGVSNGIK